VQFLKKGCHRGRGNGVTKIKVGGRMLAWRWQTVPFDSQQHAQSVAIGIDEDEMR
jgi:hypothetical protein